MPAATWEAVMLAKRSSYLSVWLLLVAWASLALPLWAQAQDYVLVAQWGGIGSGNGQLDQPQGVVADGSGNVYVADTNNHRIQKFTSGGTYLTQWGTYGSGNGQFFFPWGV